MKKVPNPHPSLKINELFLQIFKRVIKNFMLKILNL